jgi:hypothetical protein
MPSATRGSRATAASSASSLLEWDQSGRDNALPHATRTDWIADT